MFLMPPRLAPSYSTAGATRRAPCRSTTSRAGLPNVKSCMSTAPRRSITTSTLPAAGTTLTALTSPSRGATPLLPGLRPRSAPAGAGRGLRCASWRYLLLGELQTLLPLEAELLHRKHDFARPDRGGLEAPDDVARLHSIHLAVRHIAQHRDAARRIPPVVIDPDEAQVGQERSDVARPQQREERVAPAALVGEDLAHQHRRGRGRHAVGLGLGAVGFRRRRGGALRLRGEPRSNERGERT